LDRLLIADWGIPEGIISDRDLKFVFEFWTTLFKKLRTKLLMSTAYHPQTDGQSERTNQTIEIALRYFLTENPEADWKTAAPMIQSRLNNSTNASTGPCPNELVYASRSQMLAWWPESTQTRRPLKFATFDPEHEEDRFQSVTRNRFFLSKLACFTHSNCFDAVFSSRLKLFFFGS
jgi:hypothetical protein